MNNKSLARSLSRWVIAFVSTLFLFALLVLGILRMTLFNQEFMIRVTEQSNYATTITKEINENIQDLGRGSNIPTEVLDNVVSEELVQTNLNNFIRGIYTDNPFQLEGGDELYSAIEERVVNYANEMSYTVEDAAITQLVTSATDHFEQFIEIPYLTLFSQTVMAYSQTLIIMTIFCGVVFILTLLGTFLLIRHWWHLRLRFAAYILSGAGLMLIVLPLVAYLSGIVERLSISTESLYLFLTTYINEFIMTFVIWGAIVFGLAILCWIASEIVRKKVITNRR